MSAVGNGVDISPTVAKGDQSCRLGSEPGKFCRRDRPEDVWVGAGEPGRALTRNLAGFRQLPVMGMIAKLMALFQEPQKREVVVHDPKASEPRNLDETFFDERAQERVGKAISRSARKD